MDTAMDIVLNFHSLAVPANVDEAGRLHFYCPYCKQPTFLAPGYIRITDTEVRTVRPMACGYSDCGAVFEIVHSSFLEVERRIGTYWQEVGHYDPKRMHPVWIDRKRRAHERRPEHR